MTRMLSEIGALIAASRARIEQDRVYIEKVVARLAQTRFVIDQSTVAYNVSRYVLQKFEKLPSQSGAQAAAELPDPAGSSES